MFNVHAILWLCTVRIGLKNNMSIHSTHLEMQMASPKACDSGKFSLCVQELKLLLVTIQRIITGYYGLSSIWSPVEEPNSLGVMARSLVHARGSACLQQDLNRSLYPFCLLALLLTFFETAVLSI